MTPEESLARIRRYDARLKAFVRTFDPPLTGDMAGGPTFAVKDLIDVAGAPTGGGAMVPLDPNPHSHAVVVERLLQAGWSAVGKTHTVELAFGAWGTNAAVGAPWNPWDAKVHRAPGGSSSGSAVAVAAGLCDAALGSDTGGSVRIPAAICGVVGLKPGRGLVSLRGVHPLSPALDTVGTIAADVATAARMLGLMSGPDGAAAERDPFDPDEALAADVRGRRLAASPPDHLGVLHPEVARLYLEALDKLRGAGVTVDMVPPLKALDESFAPNGLIMAGEGWRHWRDRIAAQRPVMDPWIVRRFESGRGFTDRHLEEAHARRAADQAAHYDWMAPYDGLVSPTCPIPAPPIAEVDETTSPLSRLTRAANYLDLPGITVPCGLTHEGLPAGLQILGKPRDEAAVVSFGAAFERVSGWNGRRPDLSGFEG
ncbi:amidase [Phenylobacterium sp. LjRoot225]|uniref:amidase n=1 Tax=Phenylobacterium sp. LjRoot225 TaxID=3342285 RepID=UPI003ECD2F33